MSIFLSILKIIGIILGILLAILLALVLLIVFLPICYRVEGDFQEKNEIHGRLSWLFFIRVKFLAEGKKISVWLSILGFKKVLYPAEEKAARKAKKQRRSKKRSPIPQQMRPLQTRIFQRKSPCQSFVHGI